MARLSRTAWVHLKATPEERAQWQAAAADEDVTLADLIRARLTAKEVGRRPRRRIAAKTTDPALLAGIARAGNNLNQLARWANSYKGTADAFQVLTALAAIERQLSSFLLPHAASAIADRED